MLRLPPFSSSRMSTTSTGGIASEVADADDRAVAVDDRAHAFVQLEQLVAGPRARCW